jgi:hypothetical protein
MKTNKLMEEVELIIKEMHQGAITNIKICRERFIEEDLLDIDKTLHDNGIQEPGVYRILYDYDPICCPLLDL